MTIETISIVVGKINRWNSRLYHQNNSVITLFLAPKFIIVLRIWTIEIDLHSRESFI